MIARVVTLALMVSIALFGLLSGAQDVPPATPSSVPTLFDGTIVRLRLTETISSANARVGQVVPFEVLDTVKVDGMTVIAKGSTVLATVTRARPKRTMGRGGKLEVNIDSVRLVDGEKAALRAVQNANADDHVGGMAFAMVASWALFPPAAPFFLLMHGDEATIPDGTEIEAFINGDVPLDATKFPRPMIAAPVAISVPGQVIVDFRSTPIGAEIKVDGDYVGNTPSSISMSLGEHVITISKQDFRTYEHNFTVTAGHPLVVAYLEQQNVTVQFGRHH